MLSLQPYAHPPRPRCPAAQGGIKPPKLKESDSDKRYIQRPVGEQVGCQAGQLGGAAWGEDAGPLVLRQNRDKICVHAVLW